MTARTAWFRRYLFFGLAALGLLMAAIDSTIVAIAIPSMTEDLNTSLSWVGWTLTSYQLMQVVVLPLAGRLSDALGRRRVFLFCVSCFTIGSLLCGLAPNVGFLIVCRAVQAIGGGGLMPSAVGIVSDQFIERRSQAIGLFTSVFPIGGILGPNVGGWILEHWSWREIFFVNLPIGIAVLVGTMLLLRERQVSRSRLQFDLLGVLLFAGGMVSIMYAMTWAGNDTNAWQSVLLWLLLIASGVFFWLFLRQEGRAPQPAVDLMLLTHRPFLQANLYNFFFGACAFGFFSFIPYYAAVQYQMGPLQTGAVLTPRAIAMIGMSAVTSFFIHKLGYRLPMLLGMWILTGSLLLLHLGLQQVQIGPIELDGFWLLAGQVGLTGIAMGLAAPASNNASIDLLPNRAAGITGLRGMFRLTGGIFGISSIVLALSFFDDKALGMRTIFLVLAIVLQITVPLTLMIPDRDQPKGKGGQPGAAKDQQDSGKRIEPAPAQGGK